MRYQHINNNLFIKNRKNFIKSIKDKSAAVFVSNDLMPTNADEEMPFIQNTNLFYLTGIDQEDTFLILAPDFPDKNLREILFIKETSEEISIWEGNKLTKNEAIKISGIKTVLWNDEFYKILPLIIAESNNLYIEKNEHIRSITKVETAQDRFYGFAKEKFPLQNFERSYPLLSKLRMVKNNIEIKLIQKACNITEKGFRRILNYTKPHFSYVFLLYIFYFY